MPLILIVLFFIALFTGLTFLIFRKRRVLPLNKKQFYTIIFVITVLNFITAHITNILLPTGLFREQMYVARLFYDSMGGVGLYVQGLFSSAAIFIFFYWAKFLKKSEFLNWDVFLILGCYGKVADMIGDTYGLLILKSIIEQG